ncbi:peptidoglycan-binding protein [Streptomyces sp. NPDC059176]|uniref:peptidoglycan-binding domain-containing protein n=1 Tax=Streptomyces sp. NPDC059176 TaxID=3346758 RepID=UPI0036C1EA7D
MTGRTCPECGTQADADGRSAPGRGHTCSCAYTTGPQHYDQLHVRPYMAAPPQHQGDPAPLGDGAPPAPVPPASDGPGGYGAHGFGAGGFGAGGYPSHPYGTGDDVTAPLPAVGAAADTGTTAPDAPYGAGTPGDVGATAPLPVAAPAELDHTAAAPGYPTTHAAPGDPVRTPEVVHDTYETYEVVRDGTGRSGRRRRAEDGRRRRGVATLATAASVIAVLGTVAFAAGLLTRDDGKDRAAPDLESPAPFLSAGPTVRPSLSVSPTERESAADPKAPTATADASETAAGLAVPSVTSRATATAQGSSRPPSASGQAPTGLGPGDNGPDVFELQARLEQVWLYDGPFNGRYDGRVESAVADYQASRGIDGDPEGFYGPETRAALEVETDDPYAGQGGKHGGRGH